MGDMGDMGDMGNMRQETIENKNRDKSRGLKQKSVYMETWGCQMNVADSEKMLGQLQNDDYVVSDSAETADLVILNTCHIREKAKHKVMSRLGRLREIQAAKNAGMKIAVTGCVAQAEGKKLFASAPNIDVIVGPGQLDKIGQLVKEQQETGKSQIAVGFKDEDRKQKAPALFVDNGKVNPTLTGKSEVSRFINISQGCDNFCTFCVVPFTRGREISLPPGKVIEEAKGLIAAGAKEITLLGQNVNSYGLDLVKKGELEASSEGPFVDLLKSVADIPGLSRLRFTTSNPHDFTRPLARLYGTHKKLGRYLHLPMQSGSNRILEKMRRKVTVEEFYERVSWLKAADPEIALSTDLIVGFPSETDEDFAATMDLVRKTRFSFIYAFMYSERKGTAAARFEDQIPQEVKKARLKELLDLQGEITTSLNLAQIGREEEVLCHYESTKEKGIYYGRTESFRLVRVAANRDLVGKMVAVKITEANKTALVGELI